MHWYQYTMGGLLGLAAICAALMGLATSIPREWHDCFVGFLYSCGLLAVATSFASAADLVIRRLPRWAAVPVVVVGYYELAYAFNFFGNKIDRIPAFVWTEHRSHDSMMVSATFMAGGLAVLALIDCLIQVRRGEGFKDVSYYPRISGLINCLSSTKGLLVLAIGFAVVFYAYATTAIQMASAGTPIGLFGSPAMQTCLTGWAILWIADCTGRPRRDTLWVAIAFFFFTMAALTPVSVVRE
jgi:hypothetical protein